MIGLPPNGQQLTIYPNPQRRVQCGERPVDAVGGGRWMSADGEVVLWSDFHLAQLRAGDIFLHPPKLDAPKAERAAPAPYDHARATVEHLRGSDAPATADCPELLARRERAKKGAAPAAPAAVKE